MQNVGWTDSPKDGQTNRWISNGWTMFLSYADAINASVNDDSLTDFTIFTKALPTDQQTNQATDKPKDQRTYPLIAMQ